MWEKILREATNHQLVSIPLLVPLYLLVRFLGNPLPIVQAWISRDRTNTAEEPPPYESQLLAYVLVGISGYVTTNKLIPNIKQYTLRKGISGKDLGKRGTAMADKDVYVQNYWCLEKTKQNTGCSCSLATPPICDPSAQTLPLLLLNYKSK